jgi:HK97 gp10 family phage protein
VISRQEYFRQTKGQTQNAQFWKNYYSNVKRVKYVLEENEKNALAKVGQFLKKEMKKILKANTTERTGTLKKAIGYSIKKKTKSVQVGFRHKAFYGKFLELGTSKMQPKPFVMPAIVNNLGKVRAIIEENMHPVTDDYVPKTTKDEVFL